MGGGRSGNRRCYERLILTFKWIDYPASGTWSLGLAIGPCIGGSLAEPAKHFPDYFASTGIFGRWGEPRDALA